MSPSWFAFEIGINLFQTCIFLYFFKQRLHFSRKTFIADALCIIIYTLFLSSYLFFEIPFPDSFGVCIFFIYLLYTSDDHWITCALWSMFEEVLVIATVGFMLQICQTVLSAPYNLIMTPSKYRVIFVSSTNFVLFIEMFFFSKIRKESSSLHWTSLLIFLALNVSILVVIELLFSLQIQEIYSSDLPFFASYALLVLCGVLSVVLFHLMTSIAEREHQAQIALNHVQLTKDHQLAIQDMYNDMRKQRHDMKQHIQALEQLIENHGSTVAKQYWDEYKAQRPMRDSFLTGSIAVDALLTAKLLACKHHDIDFKVSQCPLNNLPISEIDFCTIVGNLLDNAIEGNNRIARVNEQKYIHLYFSRVYDMFIIRCENPVNLLTIHKVNNKFQTSKDDTPIHGFGIPNMISIAENAEGSCTFNIEENEFVATVMLPYPLKKEN